MKWYKGRNGFQLYGADNVKAREHVEWLLLRWGCEGGTCLILKCLKFVQLICRDIKK